MQECGEILGLPSIPACPQGLKLRFGVVFVFVKSTITRKKLLLRHPCIKARQSDESNYVTRTCFHFQNSYNYISPQNESKPFFSLRYGYYLNIYTQFLESSFH